MTREQILTSDSTAQLKLAQKQIRKPRTEQEKAREEAYLQAVAEVVINPPHAASGK